MSGEGALSGALVVGTGEMGRLFAARLAASGIRCTIASRSRERAARVIESLPPVARGLHQPVDMDAVPAMVSSHAVVALAIRRPDALLQAHDAVRAQAHVIDLSAPPALTAEAAAILGDRLLNLDRLGSPDATSALSQRAERQVREQLAAETDRYLAWLVARRHGSVAALHREAEAVRVRHVERLRSGGDFTDAQFAAVEQMTAALAGELVHLRGEQAREELAAESRAS